MPIGSSDLHMKLSVTTGSAGNSTAQGNVNNSLGKYISTTDITDNTLNNLFNDITGDQNAASQVDYRCIFLHNAHATLTLQSPKIWLVSQVSGGADVAIALDNVGVTNIGSSSAQADTVVSSTTAPSAVGSFSAPTTKTGGLAPANIGPGQCLAVWVRRTAANTSAVNSDGCVLRIEGDTAA